MQHIAQRIEADAADQLVELPVYTVPTRCDAARDPPADVEEIDLAVAIHPEQPVGIAAGQTGAGDRNPQTDLQTPAPSDRLWMMRNSLCCRVGLFSARALRSGPTLLHNCGARGAYRSSATNAGSVST
jgi:hypothetical protein